MKPYLLGSTALVAMALIGSQANAACTPTTTPTSNDTVTCAAGVSVTPIMALPGSSNVTVDIQNGASLTTTGTAVTVEDSSIVTLNGTGSISATTDGIDIYGQNSTVTLSGQSLIQGTDAGIYFKYPNASINTVQLSGSSNVSGKYGIAADGGLLDVTMHDTSHVDGTVFGIVVGPGYGHIKMYDDSSVTLSNAIAGTAYAIQLYGAGSHATLNDTAHVLAYGDNHNGVSIRGNASTITLNGDSHVDVHGTNAHAITARYVTYGQIDLLDHSSATATDGHAIYLNHSSHITVNIASGATAHSDSQAAIRFIYGGNVLNNYGTVSSTTDIGLLGSAGIDTVVNGGTISGGTKGIDLDAGDDTLTLTSGSHVTGGIDGGPGTDTLILNGNSTQDGPIVNFENVNVTGGNFALSGTSTFSNAVSIYSGGELQVNGAITTPTTTVAANGVLAGNGTLISDVTSNGTIDTGSNGAGTLTINGNLAQDGGAFTFHVGGGGFSKLVVQNGGVALTNAPVVNVMVGNGASGGTQTVLQAQNGITGTFGAVNFIGNGGATGNFVNGQLVVTTASGTPVVGQDFAAAEAGLDFLDTADDEQIAGLDHCGADSCDRMDDNSKHLWAKAFGHFGSQQASHGDQGFDYTVAGTAFGGDMKVTKDLRLGVTAGYSHTEQNVADHAAANDINTGQIGLYANWQHGPFFITGLLTGGYQKYDLSRQLSDGGEADAQSHGWLFGSSIQAGAQFAFAHSWRVTPSAGIAYQHSWMHGYSEHGGGSDDVSIKSYQSDALRLHAEVELADDIAVGDVVVTPSLTVGVQRQIHLGGNAQGQFSNGDDFAINLRNETRTAGLIGVGTTVSFSNGLSTYVKYNATLAGDATIHAVTGGLRYSW